MTVVLERYATKFNLELEHAAAALKIPRRPPRPDTSPLVAKFADWERRVQAALLAHWMVKSNDLNNRLSAEVRAVTDVIEDRTWWQDWSVGYFGVVLPFLEEGAQLGADEGADLLGMWFRRFLARGVPPLRALALAKLRLRWGRGRNTLAARDALEFRAHRRV